MALMRCNPTTVAILLSIHKPTENNTRGATKPGPESKQSPVFCPVDNNPVDYSDWNMDVASQRPNAVASNLNDPQSMILDFSDIESFEYPNLNRKYLEVPYIHLPLKALGKVRMEVIVQVYQIVLKGLIEYHQWKLLTRDEDHVSPVPNEFIFDGRRLNYESLTAFNLDDVDYFCASLLWRTAWFGFDSLVKLLLSAGADPWTHALDGSNVIQAAISSRNLESAVILFSRIEGASREVVVDFVKECVKWGSWRIMYVLVRVAPELTSDEFEQVARYAESQGCGANFLLTFRRAIDEEIGDDEVGLDSPVDSTGIFTHEDCRLHVAASQLVEPNDLTEPWMLTATPENVSRLDVLVHPKSGVLRCLSRFNTCRWVHNPTPVCLADIMRVHDSGYLQFLIAKCEESATVSPEKYPLVLDADTKITPQSWHAARCAAGCVIEAIKAVCEGTLQNAFCAVRPPGHHVGTYGAAQPPSKGPGIGGDVQESQYA